MTPKGKAKSGAGKANPKSTPKKKETVKEKSKVAAKAKSTNLKRPAAASAPSEPELPDTEQEAVAKPAEEKKSEKKLPPPKKRPAAATEKEIPKGQICSKLWWQFGFKSRIISR